MAPENQPTIGPPVFSGENYHIWAIKVKAYLKALNLWNVVKRGEHVVQPLRDNRTLNDIQKHDELVIRSPRALTCIHSSLTKVMFTRIMTCETTKEAWDKIKEEFEGNNRVQSVKVLALKKEFIYCKKYEHIEKYCRKKQTQRGQSSQRVNFVKDHQVEKIEEKVFMASHISHVDRYNWHVDSACTRHMAIDENVFVSLDRSNRTKAKLEDGALVSRKAISEIPYERRYENHKRCSLCAKTNSKLVECCSVASQYYSLTFKNKKCVIYDLKGCEVAKTSMIGNSFPISCYSAESCSFNVEMSDT
ncbi:uncharacterized protein LOC124887864 [Capsicum annuum]|uniref:uncharacterized protein LOC124887864 n=1 Tax=Capsicum annuum TaxID=4072 RepID=UPI001FB0F733|nr:uncharacterized protein LOC124887864 [Capsicum annuum]